jgi:hypothetical protein
MPRFTSKNGKLPYPRIVFYVVKVLQIISACAVAGVMFFFIAHLNSKKSSVPWMFYIVSCDKAENDGCRFVC